MTENQKLREALLSDMDIAVLRMPVHLAFAGNMAQFQYHNRVQSLLNRIDALALPTADHLPEVLARDIYQGLGYAKWENFSSLIKRCKQLIAHGQYAGLIEETERSVEIGSGAIRQVIDYKLDAKAHQLVTSMASAFKLIGHYPSRNETSILSLIERWCKEKKISFVPQAKAIRGHVYDALVGDCVAVEFDEPHHIGSRQKTRDAKKDSESISSGIRVLRIGIDANIIDAIVSLESMLSTKMIEPAAPVGELPELPEPTWSTGLGVAFTADQMRAYAREAMRKDKP